MTGSLKGNQKKNRVKSGKKKQIAQKDNLIENNKIKKNRKIFGKYSNSISPSKNK